MKTDRVSGVMKYQILELLQKAGGEFLSGEALRERFAVSRTAVWKAVKSLQNDGYRIEAVTNKGYRLVFTEEDILSEYEISRAVSARRIGKQLVLLGEVNSTNTYAKALADEPGRDGTVVLAQRQTNGKGRKQRAFYSPEKVGLYLSIIVQPQIQLDNLNLLTLAAAVGASRAVEELTGISPEIKWPNDILYQGKKLCGILTEVSLESETGQVQSAVIGMGFNVNNETFPDPLRERAVSLKQIAGHPISRLKTVCSVLNHMDQIFADDWYLQQKDQMLAEYGEKLALMGCEIAQSDPDMQEQARVIGIDGRGGLVIQAPNGVKKTIYNGELSMRSK